MQLFNKHHKTVVLILNLASSLKLFRTISRAVSLNLQPDVETSNNANNDDNNNNNDDDHSSHVVLSLSLVLVRIFTFGDENIAILSTLISKIMIVFIVMRKMIFKTVKRMLTFTFMLLFLSSSTLFLSSIKFPIDITSLGCRSSNTNLNRGVLEVILSNNQYTIHSNNTMNRYLSFFEISIHRKETLFNTITPILLNLTEIGFGNIQNEIHETLSQLRMFRKTILIYLCFPSAFTIAFASSLTNVITSTW